MSEAKAFLLDLLFPRRCLGCQRLLMDAANRAVCAACRRTITLKRQFACAFCQAPVVGGQTCPFCRREHHLDRLLVAADYDQPLVEAMVKAFKYRFVRALAAELAGLMSKHLAKVMASEPLFDFVAPLVVPVPLHRWRLNWRGFNQSELLAQAVAAHFSWSLAPEALRRLRHNPPQADQSDRTARLANVAGLFVCRQPSVIAGRVVLLVDDISTTASTLDDCARSLKAEGAKEVIGLVFARGK